MPISYLSDNNADYKCLEDYLESGAFGDLPDSELHQSQHDLDALNQFLKETTEKLAWVPDGFDDDLFEPSDFELPTRYDSPLYYRLLITLVNQVSEASKNLKLDTTDFPYFSSIPTREVNACAIDLACSSKPFLLFDSQIFLYCHLFSKALAKCLPIISEGKMISLSVEIDKVSSHIKSNPSLISNLSSILDAFVKTGTPANTKPTPLDSNYFHMATIIREGMELFIVAHEFGHVYSGHLNELIDNHRLHALEAVMENKSHKQEHEADLLGLILTLHSLHAKGYDLGLSFIGINLFFLSLDMADKYQHLIDGGKCKDFINNESESHPSNEVRRQVLLEYLGVLYSDENLLESATSLSKNYEEIIDYLCGELETWLTNHST